MQLIDQRFLPHQFVIEDVSTVAQMATAIREMHVRGAGLIGASAGYGMYLAVLEAGLSQTGGISAEEFDAHLADAAAQLKATRPTAVNLTWAIERVRTRLQRSEPDLQKNVQEKIETRALRTAKTNCRRRRRELPDDRPARLESHRGDCAEKNGKPVNVLTHCNAGWLAFVDYGSALAPVYAAHDRGLPVHVWVDETRPRSQGSKLTAWELGQHGVPHTIIADSAGGHLMQRGEVDLVIVGSDRTTCTGDVANKIGTYLKALAAQDNGVPFYVALPSSSFDWTIRDGSEIPIEERGAEELKRAEGWRDGQTVEVRVAPEASPAANYGFDVTPRRLVTGLITERGVCKADEKSILELFPEHAS